MKLFTVGPVEMYEETLRIGAQPEPYFRTPEFSRVMLEIEEWFLRSVNAPKDARFAALTCSGTGAMEAAVAGSFSATDKVLVIDGGSFGHRFVQICDIHGIPRDVLNLSFGEGLTRAKLDAFAGGGYTALLVNLSETSTGQLYDIAMLHEFCEQEHLLLVVDAVSAYLADPIDMQAHGVDLLLTASQKALALAPGLALAAASPRMVQQIERTPRATLYLDLAEHFLNQKRGQPPFTSAVGTVLMLHARLKGIDNAGIAAVNAEHAARAQYFRAMLPMLGLSTFSYPLSNSCTPILFPNGGATHVYETLKNTYEIYLTPSGGVHADNILRVGHLGNLTLSDYDDLAEKLKEVMK